MPNFLEYLRTNKKQLPEIGAYLNLPISQFEKNASRNQDLHQMLFKTFQLLPHPHTNQLLTAKPISFFHFDS